MYKFFGVLLMIVVSTFALSNVDGLRDPTIPLGRSVVGSATNSLFEMHLNSILISQQRRVAVINGQALRQGEQLNGSEFRVLSINSNSVTVEANNRRQVLSLINSKVKK